MVNGTTITASYEAPHKEGWQRLVRAWVETPLRAHQIPTRPSDSSRERHPSVTQHGAAWGFHHPVADQAYPSLEGILNAWELSRMRYEDAQGAYPIALWDMHYLRELDLSGFIDELLEEEPVSVREK